MRPGRGGIAAAVALPLIAAVLGPAENDTARVMQDRYLCGPRCLVFCARWLGYDADVPRAVALADTDRRRGTTLNGLVLAAREFGLEARPWRLGLKHVGRITARCPGIAHVDGDHFVVVWTDGRGDLHWIEPPTLDRIVTREDFGRRWSGAIVILSRHGQQPRWTYPSRWLASALLLAAGAIGGWKIGKTMKRRQLS